MNDDVHSLNNIKKGPPIYEESSETRDEYQSLQKQDSVDENGQKKSLFKI